MEKLSLKIANYYVKSITLQKGTTIKIEKATSKTEIVFFDILINTICWWWCKLVYSSQNLFTGTRALNANFEDEQSSMVYYENKIANYIKNTNHHVRYRVTPIFRNVELVARGVRMEAQSIEDDEISFDVYIFNIQPGYKINYLTGSSQKN